MSAAMGLSPKELLEFMGEEGFWQAVASEKAGWRSRVPHIQEAIYKNAIDKEHKDQWVWMQRFERMTGLEFLPHEGAEDLKLK
jgi:hypothetical protein